MSGAEQKQPSVGSLLLKDVISERWKHCFAVGTLSLAVKMQEHIAERRIPSENY
jgi:hypothetical protein